MTVRGRVEGPAADAEERGGFVGGEDLAEGQDLRGRWNGVELMCAQRATPLPWVSTRW